MPPPVLKPGDVVGSYQIVEPIGRGGMGQVFLARHRSIPGRKAAIKVALTAGASARAKADFQNEIDTMSRVRHPNVVELYDAGQLDDGTSWMVLEYIEGRPLNELVRDEGRLLIEDALLIGAEIADGVAAAHAVGILHRDIKPSNVIITPDDQVKVVDFGIAKALRDKSSLDAVSTQVGYVKGTTAFLAPEVLLPIPGVKPGMRQDIFALGVLLYIALAGRHPFADEDGSLAPGEILAQRIIMLKEVPLSKVLFGFPEDVAQLVGKMMKKAPSERHATMTDVAGDIRACRDRFLGSPEGSKPQLRSIASRRAARARMTAEAAEGTLPRAAEPTNPRRGGTVLDRPAEAHEMADLSPLIAERNAAYARPAAKGRDAPPAAKPVSGPRQRKLLDDPLAAFVGPETEDGDSDEPFNFDEPVRAQASKSGASARQPGAVPPTETNFVPPTELQGQMACAALEQELAGIDIPALDQQTGPDFAGSGGIGQDAPAARPLWRRPLVVAGLLLWIAVFVLLYLVVRR